WGRWDRPLAAVFHFDGTAWRFHSELNAPTEPLQAAQWIDIEGDVLAMQLFDASVVWDPAPVVIFRLDGGEWRHETTLPVQARWVAINEGRIAIPHVEGLALYTEAAPGQWELGSIVRGARGT